MISRILYFIIIIFCINLVVVGLGLSTFEETRLNKLTPFTATPDTYTTNIDISQDVFLPDVGNPDSVTESPTMPEYIPETKEGYATLKAISGVAGGLMFGWATILILLSLPAILIYGILGVIAPIQVFSLFYLIFYAIAAIRGRL